jgi:hypothetical protein
MKAEEACRRSMATAKEMAWRWHGGGWQLKAANNGGVA